MRHPFDPRDPHTHFAAALRGHAPWFGGPSQDEHMAPHARGGPPMPPGFPPFPAGGPGFPPGPFRGAPRPADLRGGRGHGRERGHGRRHGGPGRARRGDVRAAILALLAEHPMHGYEMIKEITERSGGYWRPSPGSVYPTLQLLADEGLVTTEEGGSGKRLYALTEEGRAEVAKQDETPPWAQASVDVDPNEIDLRSAFGLLSTAVFQVFQAATSDQKAKATKVVNDARTALYLILAEAGIESEPEEADTDEVDDQVDEG